MSKPLKSKLFVFGMRIRGFEPIIFCASLQLLIQRFRIEQLRQIEVGVFPQAQWDSVVKQVLFCGECYPTGQVEQLFVVLENAHGVILLLVNFAGHFFTSSATLLSGPLLQPLAVAAPDRSLATV